MVVQGAEFAAGSVGRAGVRIIVLLCIKTKEFGADSGLLLSRMNDGDKLTEDKLDTSTRNIIDTKHVRVTRLHASEYGV